MRNDEVMMPCNTANQRYATTRQSHSFDQFERKKRVVTPTEFLTNNDEFGRLKESNDTIFSFGTSE